MNNRTNRDGALNDVLGRFFGRGAGGAAGAGGLLGQLGDALGGKGGAGGISDMLGARDGKYGLGHVGAAAALGLLLGSGKARKLAARGAVVGGVAWLGKMAYDAYAKGQTGAPEPQAEPVHELSGPRAEHRGAAILMAMIAAAKADGHIDEAEKRAIGDASDSLGPDGRNVLMEELSKPLDAREIAARADSDQARRELYAVSVMVCGGDDPKEQAYLDELADALGLSRAVTREIEARMAAAPPA